MTTEYCPLAHHVNVIWQIVLSDDVWHHVFMTKSIRDKVVEALEAKRVTAARLHEVSGVSYNVITNLKRRPDSSTSTENGMALLSALRDLGIEDGIASATTDDPALPATTSIPIYDIAAAAGPGMIVDEYLPVAANLSFPPDYLRTITNTKPDNLAIISVVGASMSPTLHHNDIVMVDMTKTRWAFDGIYVLQVDGVLKVKRIRRSERDEWVTLRSDNPQVPDEDVPMIDVTVIGRVIWSGRKEA